MAKNKGKVRKMFKKMKGTSNLEKSFAEILTEQNIKFEQHFVFKNREFDFLLIDYDILIETHGCFYHCCKQHNPEQKYPFQRRNLKNDQNKVNLVKFDKTYKLLVIWEHELNNIDELIKKLNEFTNKHKKVIEG